jgi:hypothetical protein
MTVKIRQRRRNMADSRIGGSRKVARRAGESTRVSMTKKRKKRRSRKATTPSQPTSPPPVEATDPTKAP